MDFDRLRLHRTTHNIDNNSPIGVFDSGVGGLTVVRELMRLLPSERIIYFADTKRLPYGNKEPEEISFWTTKAAHFLLNEKVKLLILACHTATACTLATLEQELPVPVIGIIEPGIDLLLSTISAQKKCAILGTPRLITSDIYPRLIRKKNPDLEIHAVACPLFASFVEEGHFESPAVLKAVQNTLAPLQNIPLDAVLLACTHYSFLSASLRLVLTKQIPLLEPAVPCADYAKQLLSQQGLLANRSEKKEHKWFISAYPERFSSFAEMALGLSVRTQFIELE